MKQWIKVILMLGLSIGLGIYARHSPQMHGVKGTVLAVEDDYALISRRLDLEPHDLTKSPDEWVRGNYDLIQTRPLKGMKVGQRVKVMIERLDDREYPLRASVKDYRILE